MMNFPFYFRLSPPYHVYVISLLTFLLLQYNWISCIQYSYRVAPPTLVATVIALNSCFQNMLGNLKKVKTDNVTQNITFENVICLRV